MSQKEYSTTKIGIGCAYKPLGSYTDNDATSAPSQQLSGSRTVVIVPSYGIPGFVKISHESAPCGGYASLGDAYKNTCNY